MNAFARIRALVRQAVGEMAASGELPAGMDMSAVTVQPPRAEGRGELATNAALALARPSGMPARALADALAGRLSRCAEVREAEVAGPGFLNLRVAPELWHASLRMALGAGSAYGKSAIGAGEKVNVEFVSANPTGPLHVAHSRGAVYGDALASLLAFCGWDVVREYYVNDAGAQVDVLARTVHARYRQALGDDVKLGEDAYPGAYLAPVGRALADKFGESLRDRPEAEWLQPVRAFAVDAMMEAIRSDLSALGVRMDRFTSESELAASGSVEETVAELKARDLVYVGSLPPPKGTDAADWAPRAQLLFRSSAHGDDSDRPLCKADGSWAYFAPDVAYHRDKVKRGFQRLINVWGEDHGGYVARMKAAVAAVSEGAVELDVKLCRIVRLLRDGRPFAMSKRKGDFVLIRDFLREIDADAVRFTLLARRNDAALDLDVVRALDRSRDNPVFYVHYAHARACSALRKAREEFPGESFDDRRLADADLGCLRHPSDILLARRIAGWPDAVEAAALAHEPHRISYYLDALAGELHALWTLGGDEPELRFVQPDNLPVTLARAALLRSAAIVIAAGLGILGIQPRDEMR